MISDLETKSSKKLSKELTDIFKNAIRETGELADKAPHQIVESVHLIRKRLKFLRAFVKLTQFCTKNHTYKLVNYILRDSGQTISDCRDAHVRGLLLDEFAKTDPFKKGVKELQSINNAHTKEIENNLMVGRSAFESLVDELSDKQVTGYVKSLEADASCIISGLSLGYEKSYHAFQSELTSHEADLLHEWRKRTKDLQYQLEALQNSIPEPFAPSYSDVVALCEILGRINDLYMFLEWLNSIEISHKFTGHTASLKNKLKDELRGREKEADKLGNTLFTLTPDEYNEKLRAELEL